MSAFAHMASSLASAAPWPAPARDPAEPRPANKTQAMRELLRAYGRADAVRLAMEAGLERTGSVNALLKGDLASERVTFRAPYYYWNTAHDERQAVEVRQAIALLKRQGYKVTKP